MEGFVTQPVFSEQALKGLSLNVFWKQFLQNIVDADTLNTLFDASTRLRSVSTMMNRSELHSCPRSLFRALEENLTLDTLVSTVTWVESQFAKNVKPFVLSETLTAYEDACADWAFEECMSFFKTLRLHISNDVSFYDFNLFLCAVRITWLGLHTIYGDQMTENITLRQLRTSKAATPEQLWRHAHNALRGDPLHWEAPTDAIIPDTFVPSAEQNVDIPKPSATVTHDFPDMEPFLHDCKRQANQLILPHGNQYTAHDGWYVVANWTDPHIYLNDKPAATYNGARFLSAVPNGAVIYVIDIKEYNGLHNTPAVWGYTRYFGVEGYVPMNLLVRLHLP